MHNKCIESKASKYDITGLNIRYDINHGHFPNSVQIRRKKEKPAAQYQRSTCIIANQMSIAQH